jgi:catechol 2,3-dioxygenase-like lactoylglutathione lyase family enzyme
MRLVETMLHHLSLGTREIERAVRFYDAVLAPLGYVRVWSDLRSGGNDQAVGYGPAGAGDKLAIKQVANAPMRVDPGLRSRDGQAFARVAIFRLGVGAAGYAYVARAG